MKALAFARGRAVEAGLFAATLAAALASYARYFHGGETFEFCHYAEIASNLLAGKGFSTRAFYPSSLAYLHEAGIAVRGVGPVFENFPGYAAWSALWLAVGGRGDFGMYLGNAVAHALGAALIYGLGRTLFSKRAAFAAAALWALDPVLLAGFDMTGQADLLFGVVFGVLAVFFWAALRDASAGPRRFAALGLAAGAAFLVRYSFTLWVPLFLAAPFALRRRGAARESAAFLGAFAALWLPWAIFEKFQMGRFSPALGAWNLADRTVVDALAWMNYRTYPLSDFLAPGVPLRIAAKAWFLFNNIVKEMPTTWALVCFFPFAVTEMAEPGPASGLACWLVLLLGWEVLAMSFLKFEAGGGFLGGRYYLWAAPFVLLYACSFFARRARSSRAWRRGLAVLAAVVVQLWLAAYVSVPRTSGHPSRLPIGRWPELEYVRDATPADSWLLTNIPTQVAWYAGRHAINIPNSPSDVLAIERDWPVDYLLLTKDGVGELYNYDAWRALLASSARERILDAMGFAPEKAFEDSVLYRRKSG